ncbi:uncharacterized protein LOC134240038 [Saccostrea cucullata]|uniref:uncharacterized protein LOC134240038 n=1 Tax=Saccostrea cuccullata TaxID=36930 RepID=UPI002ED4AD28
MKFLTSYELQCLFLSCCFLTVLCGFNHRVLPACSKTKDVCKFEFDVRYKFSMVHYFNGYAAPIVLRNGTLLKRGVYDSKKFDPLTPKELNEILTVDGVYKLLYSINGEFPAPPIVVYEGQVIEVMVKNSLINEGFTIHWHGMTQKNTPWMDGVAMVTQCPINPGNSFLYRFKAEPRGTHWYHAHQGTMRTDGLAGPLIVLPHEERLDIPEVEDDFILMIQDWNRNTSSTESSEIQLSNMHVYINDFNCTNNCFEPTHKLGGCNMGVRNTSKRFTYIFFTGHFYPHHSYKPLSPELPLETYKVKPDKYYRFRVINSAMMFTFRFSVDEHLIHVISTDGNDVEMETAQSVIISTGESFDILVKTDGNPKRNYYIRAETTEVKSKQNDKIYPGRALAILRYEDAPMDLPKTTRHKCSKERMCKVLNCPFQLYPADAHILCMSAADFRSTSEMVSKHPVPLPPRGEKMREDFLNFHFSGIRGYPAMAAINGHKFQLPTCPPQIIYDPPARTCFNDCQDHDCGEYCECTHTLKYDQLNSSVQLVLVNTDSTNGGTNHPVHIHGHHFHILKIGYAEVDKETGLIVHESPDIRCAGKNCKYPSWSRDEWAGGKVPGLNLENPPLKDTVVVPRKGYVVLRFHLDNPGYWLMHCHMKSHQLEGMTLIIREGRHADQKKPPKNFPTCGDFTWSYNEYQEIVNGPTVGLTRSSNDSTQNENNTGATSGDLSTSPLGDLSHTIVTIFIVTICITGLVLIVVIVKSPTQRVEYQRLPSGGIESLSSTMCAADRQPLLSSRPKVRVNGSIK